MRRGVHGRARRGRSEDEAGLGGDLLGDAVLEGEDIRGGAFEGLGPEVAVGACVDELGGDADAVAGADDGAFDDRIDVELRAMSGSERREPLSAMTEVRETTRRLGIRASSVMSSSVMPSAKYSWEGSPERFCRGTRRSSRSPRDCLDEEAASERMPPEGQYRNWQQARLRTGRRTAKVCAGVPSDSRRNRRSNTSGARSICGGGAISRTAAGSTALSEDGADWAGSAASGSTARNGCDEPVTRSGDCLHKLRWSGLSPRVWRILRIAVLIPCSMSTKTSCSHRHLAISSRFTTWPCFVTRRMRSSRGFRSSLSLRPLRLSSNLPQ